MDITQGNSNHDTSVVSNTRENHAYGRVGAWRLTWVSWFIGYLWLDLFRIQYRTLIQTGTLCGGEF